MLRDDRDSGGGRRRASRNVFGDPLEACSIRPITGFYRDSCCNTGRENVGSHTVCAVMTAAFLDFSKSLGNELSTPVPEFGFAGLKPGDRWCLCAPRWQQAFGQATLPAWSCVRPMRVHSPTARLPTLNASRWTSRDPFRPTSFFKLAGSRVRGTREFRHFARPDPTITCSPPLHR